jgi:methylated-DNA-[protein]-cysteine S-methyltransferase
MTFVIQWVNSCSGSTETIKLITPAGALIISIQQDVIVNANWDFTSKFDSEVLINQKQFAWMCSDTKNIVDIKLLQQGSAFRHKVWAELCIIPFGETITYSALAYKIGSSARAVGNACRDNPYPLIIPCHRAVSVSGLGGYCGHTSGDFMAIKHKLLVFEAECK